MTTSHVTFLLQRKWQTKTTIISITTKRFIKVYNCKWDCARWILECFPCMVYSLRSVPVASAGCTSVRSARHGSCRSCGRNTRGYTQRSGEAPPCRTPAADDQPRGPQRRRTIINRGLWIFRGVIGQAPNNNVMRSGSPRVPHLVVPAAQAELSTHAHAGRAVLLTHTVLWGQEDTAELLRLTGFDHWERGHKGLQWCGFIKCCFMLDLR